MILTHAQVHAGDKRPDEGGFTLRFSIVIDQFDEEHAEREANPVDDDVTNEWSEHHHPTPPAIWW